ncbi:GLYL3 protein, partial [Certhia brachydactyla]|nr:GLYL3 protein [Certhia familiaris]NXO97007.1 GLYL3 protein [Certhia brachydactyla]
MKILTCPAQLQRLEGILRKSLPLALPVFGAVLNINRGNPGQCEVLVDKWPEFGAVLARPSGEVASGDRGHCMMGVTWCPGTVLGRDWACYERCWAALGVWDTGESCWRNWEVLVKGIRGSGGLWGWVPAPGVRVGSLSPSHVDLLNETWPYGGNARSRRYLAEILGRFPQVCLQDSSGQPVAWVLTDHFGTGTHSYTLPEHRRHGHMQVALTVAAQRAHARGFPTFG